MSPINRRYVFVIALLTLSVVVSGCQTGRAALRPILGGLAPFDLGAQDLADMPVKDVPGAVSESMTFWQWLERETENTEYHYRVPPVSRGEEGVRVNIFRWRKDVSEEEPAIEKTCSVYKFAWAHFGSRDALTLRFVSVKTISPLDREDWEWYVLRIN